MVHKLDCHCASCRAKKGEFKGKNNPFYGKHHTEEIKHILSEQKTKENHPLWGKHIPEETIRKMSEAHLGKKNPFYGRKHTEESKRLIKEHTARPFLGRHHTEESKKKLSESHKGIYDGKNNPMYGKTHSKETIQKILNNFNPSGPELYLDSILQNYFPDEWKYVGDGNTVLNGLCPDFINVNGKKLIIELFGEYWHKGEKIPLNRTEEGRKEVYKKMGFDTLVIWSAELSNEDLILEKIKNFIIDKR